MLAQGFCDSMVQLAGGPHSLLPGISTTLNWVATAARGRAYGNYMPHEYRSQDLFDAKAQQAANETRLKSNFGLMAGSGSGLP
jgi:hypothetical protein